MFSTPYSWMAHLSFVQEFTNQLITGTNSMGLYLGNCSQGLSSLSLASSKVVTIRLNCSGVQEPGTSV